ncbi:MAG: alpha/beta hydrolase [Erythrobacter sp.]
MWNAILTALVGLTSTTAVAAAGPPAVLTAPGPEGELSGTLIAPGQGKPVVLIIPGSGPFDRDGNSPIGVRTDAYRLLAEALAGRDIGSLRIDKRGMFASKHAVADGNAVVIADYVADTAEWVAAARTATGAPCIWLLGHSEGGIVALAAGQALEGLCGLVLVAAPGRPFATILREQLAANPANASVMPEAEAAIAALEAGERIDVSAFHPALQRLFAPPVQGYLIDLMTQDPAAMAAATGLPVLILRGTEDLQVTKADADALAQANSAFAYREIEGMNHVLKLVPEGDLAANRASYADPSLPIASELVRAVADFVTLEKEAAE